MSDADKVAKLRKAQTLINEVMGTLETDTIICATCGHVASVNQHGRAQWEMLNAAQERCGKVANWIGREMREAPLET